MSSIIKRLSISALALGISFSGVIPQTLADSPLTAFAAEVSTSNGIATLGTGKAQIMIQPNMTQQSLVGKQFNVYKLFDAQNAKGKESINYTFNSKYEAALKKVVAKYMTEESSNIYHPQDITEYMVIDYIQTMNTNVVEGADANQIFEGLYSKYRYFIEDLRKELVNLNLKPDVININDVKSDGSFLIDGLDYGYYVVDEVYTSGNEHSAASLIMCTTANPNAQVVIKSDYPTIVKKIKEDDKEVGWNDIADFEIGQTVPFKYESTVANMNGYHTYYYAWHDMMDEALTFNKDSVSIKIHDPSTNKTYNVKANEFNINENLGNNETFKIEIDDIKAIIDREFNEDINDLNHNVYDQQVTLYYEATLNDKAAFDTGRPGFENDVQLEFSNNPDADATHETGKTPWDTVVCFTYKLNGLKVNNHDLKLEGAKFRLYSDKECQNEVYVKESEQGYIVINRDTLGGDNHNGGTKPTEAVEMISDTDGIFKIFGLDQGTYYLSETDSPDGYRELLDPIEIIITPTFTEERNDYLKGNGVTDQTLVSLDATAEVKEFLSGVFDINKETLETNVDEGALNLTVVNTVGSKLPITGSSAAVIMIVAGGIIMTVALRKSKQTRE